MRATLHRLAAVLLVTVLALGGAPGAPPGAGAAVAAQCFGETDQCVGPLFLDYWQRHAGLALNGYPLGAERVEVLEDGNPYTVQYFERVRLEYHPEHLAPYDVLLGQFGRRIHGGADTPVGPSGDGTYDAETGHNIGGAFLAYWQGHGGLAQFGYPISEEFVERLEDGREYTVQYFERARFELHPENPPPYDVLLGQFGRRILAESAARAVPTCRAADLAGDLVLLGAAGSREGNFQLINTTDAPCALAGRPGMQLLDQDGAPLAVDVQEDVATPDEQVGVVGAGRGQAIRVRLRWSNYCGPDPGAATALLTLPGGGQVRAAGASVPPCLGATQPATLGVGPFAAGGQDQAAANVVLGYVGAIGARDYPAAYAALGAEMRARQPYADFAAGFAATARDRASRLVIGGSSAPGAYQIRLHLAAEQTDGSVEEFAGAYTVGPEGGALKILAASVTPAGP